MCLMIDDDPFTIKIGNAHHKIPLYIKPSDFVDCYGNMKIALNQLSVIPSVLLSHNSSNTAGLAKIKKYLQRRIQERGAKIAEIAKARDVVEREWKLHLRKREAEWGEPENLGVPQGTFGTGSFGSLNDGSGSSFHPITNRATFFNDEKNNPNSRCWTESLADIPDQLAALPSHTFNSIFIANSPPPRHIPNSPTLPWSNEERKMFIQIYLQHPKNFAAIKEKLPYKNVNECVEFYYRNKKKFGLKQMVVNYRKSLVVQKKVTVSGRPVGRPKGKDKTLLE